MNTSESIAPASLNTVVSQPVVIEFVGPTGGGKTTNCSAFVAALQKRGQRVATFSDFKRVYYASGVLNLSATFLKTIFFDFPRVWAFARFLATYGILTLDSIKRFVKLCFFDRGLIQFCRSRQADVIILDQWVIQGLWSATIFNRAPADEMVPSLAGFFFNVDHLFYFDVDVQTASDRISGRTTGKSRFDTMDTKKRLAETARFNDYLFKLYKASSCRNKKIFSAFESPDVNARLFDEYFMEADKRFQS